MKYLDSGRRSARAALFVARRVYDRDLGDHMQLPVLSLPVLDVAAMKHIAYVFDALIYYMRSGTDAAAAVRMDGFLRK